MCWGGSIWVWQGWGWLNLGEAEVGVEGLGVDTCDADWLRFLGWIGVASAEGGELRWGGAC